MNIYGYNPFGYDGTLVQMDVEIKDDFPAVDIIGIQNARCDIFRKSVKDTVSELGYTFPGKRVLIAATPCDMKKDGRELVLAASLAVIARNEGLDGDDLLAVRGRGISHALKLAQEQGIKRAIIPDSYSGTIPAGLAVYRLAYGEHVDNQLIATGKDFSHEVTTTDWENVMPELDKATQETWDNIDGQDWLKFALAVAAAGGHHIVTWGAPGCGKTMLCQSMQNLIPLITMDEAKSTERIYDIAGIPRKHFTRERPFRMPHHTASIEGMCGGGANMNPGEISLAHNGVLFLDEAAEFKTSVLQMLRIPMESGNITLCRAGRSTVFPAKFQLVMATNTCPCGNYGTRFKSCLCSAHSIELYWKKFSAPLLDRFEIRVNCNEKREVRDVSFERLRTFVGLAYTAQLKRGKRNHDLNPQELADIRAYEMSADAQAWYDSLRMEGFCTPRQSAGILKVARTIADMKGLKDIQLSHVMDARELLAMTPAETL